MMGFQLLGRDPLAPHDKPKHPSHGRAIAAGSGTVMIDGKPAARVGDAVDCGGVLQEQAVSTLVKTLIFIVTLLFIGRSFSEEKTTICSS